MSDSVKRLLAICSDELSKEKSVVDCQSLFNSSISKELDSLLKQRNGFYGFESSLHVFPYDTTDSEIGLKDWNKKELWINSYEDLATDALFFAEDVFGGQFCLRHDGVYSFEPETAEFNKMALTINDWCERLLSDYNVITGYALAHSWQISNGKLPSGYRLIPRIPFVAGGEYELDNLYMCKSNEALIARANIALQIRDIPDGGSMQIIITD
ncbi:hypothetical protein A9B99_22735 [Mangrovibacter phragmitis]|uniref:SMI1/KNR4 family protein n=1 Tax=Mangrovibacter phragmitis TaxID=1691903 RepID=A0A1B7L2Z3_9ENTR|nr:SMI1/KNR4 family protein [Mangrovibacter phragmitis]OAT76774.1 hypothetical protein A9B99_22735 [Mangrovibacter phragmitis]